MTELVLPIKRVEQYLYALCVLDFSNIPVPRSRLEIFAHAMITGEVPEIAPETREEEYMVAIIKGDVSNLPTPKSRADHLLYRICLGETEIRDIELETRYEMLLAYLAEHGGTDLEYALINYTKAFETLYNTVEMPFKSAILSGQTLVNLSPTRNKVLSRLNGHSPSIGLPINMFKSDVYYIAFIDIGNVENATSTLHFQWKDNNQQKFNVIADNASTLANTKVVFKFKQTLVNPTALSLTINSSNPADCKIEIKNFMVIEYQEGMENWDIPYFEGMQSVKMPVLTTTGKNLFDITKHNDLIINDNGEYITTKYYGEAKPVKYSLKKNTTYSVSYVKNGTFSMTVNGVWVNTNGSSAKFTTDDSGEYIIKIGANSYININKKIWDNIQIEEGSTATTYEPFKSNILTTSEEVELRGIGDVKDELNVATGEVTERIGEVVLDGRENWKTHSFGYVLDSTPLNIKHITTADNQIAANFIANKLPVVSIDMLRVATIDCIAPSRDRYKDILIHSETVGKSNLNEFKEWLSQNPITIQYQLATESIKTVDLIIQDQDDQPTKLKTFNDVTHVETQADSVLPTVILEYGTKNQEVLAALSQDHEEVADAQAALSDAIDSQSDEVETTMMALTEVYEGRNEE